MKSFQKGAFEHLFKAGALRDMLSRGRYKMNDQSIGSVTERFFDDFYFIGLKQLLGESFFCCYTAF
jgi:hypothetical protein